MRREAADLFALETTSIRFWVGSVIVVHQFQRGRLTTEKDGKISRESSSIASPDALAR